MKSPISLIRVSITFYPSYAIDKRVTRNYDQIMTVHVTFNENFIYHILHNGNEVFCVVVMTVKNSDTKVLRSQQFSSYKRSKLIKSRTIKFIFVSIGKFMDIISVLSFFKIIKDSEKLCN